MIQEYPINLSIPPHLSRQRSYAPAQLRAWRKMIEDYINDRAKASPQEVINYGDIEINLGISKEVIKRFLMKAGGGSNAITIYNSNFKSNNT